MNKELINNLKILVSFYNQNNDIWRERYYKKAIISIESYPKKIKDINDINNINIGSSMKYKIKEFLETGNISCIQKIKDEKIKLNNTLSLFKNIWGIGPVKAKKLYDLGFRNLEDLYANKQQLTYQQNIGLKYYHELLKNISKNDITIFKKNIIKYLDKKFGFKTYKLEIAGSYRRGKLYSGDVDIIISPLNPNITLKKIVDILKEKHIISDILSLRNEKFMGIATNKNTHFRLDIEFLPIEEFSTGLLYFTGSKEFNIEIRSYAKKNGYLLNQHGLYKDYLKIKIDNEIDIFKILNFNYVKPINR